MPYTAADFNNQDLWKIYDATVNATGGIGGGGTLNYVPKYTPDGASIGNSQIFDNGTDIAFGHALPAYFMHAKKNEDTYTSFLIENASAGAGAASQLVAYSGTQLTAVQQYGANFTTATFQFQNGGALASTGVGGLSIVASALTGDIRFYAGGETAKAILLANGDFGVGISSPTAKGHFYSSGVAYGTFGLIVENGNGVCLSVGNDGSVGINTLVENAGLIVKEKSNASGLSVLGVHRFDDTVIMNAQSDLVYTFENADGTVLNGGVDAYGQQVSDNIVANTNNFVIPQSSLVEITSTGSWDLTGIVPPGTGEQVIYLYKSNAGTITFKNNSASSSSVNRFLPFTGADFTLVMGQVIRLIYINARWRLF